MSGGGECLVGGGGYTDVGAKEGSAGRMLIPRVCACAWGGMEIGT